MTVMVSRRRVPGTSPGRQGGSLMFPTHPSRRAAPFHPGEPRRCTRKPLPDRYWLQHLWQHGHSRVSCNEADSGSLIAAAHLCAASELHGRDHSRTHVDATARPVSLWRDQHLAADWVCWTLHDVPEPTESCVTVGRVFTSPKR